MVTTGSKFFFGLSAFAFVAAAVYGLFSGGDWFGPFVFGLKGNVGEQFGYAVLVSLGLIALFLGLVTSAIRDADPVGGPSEAEAEALATAPQASYSGWPVVSAFAVALIVIGLVLEPLVFIAGLVALAIVIVEWMVQAWSDRATGDPRYNRELRNRVMLPFEIPVGTVLVIAALVVPFSRVLLAVSQTGAVVVAIVAASLILLTAILFATRPRIGSAVVSSVLVLGAVVVIGGGIVAAAVGERDFEEHGHEAGGGEPVGEVKEVVARDLAFEPSQIQIGANETFTIELHNEDEGVQHNIHVEELDAKTEVGTGPSVQRVVLTAEEPGEYVFMCDVHPDMEGQLRVEG
jgi:plastocyanin